MNSYLASLGPALANHLWQSTVFGLLAWLLTFALRSNRARVRYAIWMAASIKFLIPLSLLTFVGNSMPHPQRPIAPVIYSTMDAVEEPFASPAPPSAFPEANVLTLQMAADLLPTFLGALWLIGVGIVFFGWWNRWRVFSTARCNATPAVEGRELQILRRLQSECVPAQGSIALSLFMSRERMEPGIFGTFRPALIWPEQLSATLNDEHVTAIIAHELMHVRRRDNLTALIHMIVEATFWFHPLVWWMERELVKEREQACDEAVVEMGGNAQVYGESLLKTCQFCVESPLPCVAGITGGELGKRIRSILTFRPQALSRATRFALFATVAGTIAAPIVLGLAHQRLIFGQILKATGPRPSFEVASIHLFHRSPPPSAMVGGEQIIRQQTVKISPGRGGGQTSDRVHLIAPVGVLIAMAYGLPPGSDGRADGRIVGGPAWMTQDLDQYDIQAKIEEKEYAAMQKMSGAQQREQVSLMEQSLLEERFKLKIHFETRERPAYALVVAKGGPKLISAKEGEPTKLSTTQRGQATELTATATTFAQFADSPLLTGGTGSRTVIDQTGLKGSYDFSLRWREDDQVTATEPSSDQPLLFTAIQEQLGLKLVPTKGPVEVIVIDRIEKPTVDGPEMHPQTISPTISVVKPGIPIVAQR